MHLGQLLKETIILLITMNVIYLLLPKWLKRTLKSITRLIRMVFKEVDTYAKRALREYSKKRKKATQKAIEQPSNVITITYPDGRVKSYPKTK